MKSSRLEFFDVLDTTQYNHFKKSQAKCWLMFVGFKKLCYLYAASYDCVDGVF